MKMTAAAPASFPRCLEEAGWDLTTNTNTAKGVPPRAIRAQNDAGSSTSAAAREVWATETGLIFQSLFLEFRRSLHSGDDSSNICLYGDGAPVAKDSDDVELETEQQKNSDEKTSNVDNISIIDKDGINKKRNDHHDLSDPLRSILSSSPTKRFRPKRGVCFTFASTTLVIGRIGESGIYIVKEWPLQHEEEEKEEEVEGDFLRSTSLLDSGRLLMPPQGMPMVEDIQEMSASQKLIPHTKEDNSTLHWEEKLYLAGGRLYWCCCCLLSS